MRPGPRSRRARVLAAEYQRRIVHGLDAHPALAHVTRAELEHAWRTEEATFVRVAWFGATDDRRDPWLGPPVARPILERARRTCCLVSASAVAFEPDGSARLQHQVYGSYNALCESEAFWQQPSVMERRDDVYASLGYTGFALDTRTILTCWHGWDHLSYEPQYAVFDYAMRADGDDPTHVPAHRICPVAPYPLARPNRSDEDEEDEAADDEHAARPRGDWVVLALERPAAHLAGTRAPAFSRPRQGRGVYALGHPRGLPLKLVDQAQVLGVERGVFRTDLDTYVGNSGSPVFDARTHALVGIVSAGQKDEGDFEAVPARGCYVSNRVEALVSGQYSVAADAFATAATAALRGAR